MAPRCKPGQVATCQPQPSQAAGEGHRLSVYLFNQITGLSGLKPYLPLI